MGTVVTTKMTFEEFERLPDQPGRQELVEGELVEMPPAKKLHNDSSTEGFVLLREAVARLRSAGNGMHLGKVCHEMGYVLASEPRSWLQPDISISHPDQPVGDYFEGAPLMAFETVSDNDRAAMITAKTELLLAHGAREVWMLYPKTRLATVHTPDGAIRKERRSITSPLVPSVEIPFDQFLCV